MTCKIPQALIQVASTIMALSIPFGTFAASPVSGDLPTPPASVEELAHYMNQCIALDDLDCLMSIVEPSLVIEENERDEVRNRWKRCLSEGETKAYHNTDFDLSEFVDRRERAGFIYTLPMKPVGLVNVHCDFGSTRETGQSWIGHESSRFFVMRWRKEPIQVDPNQIRMMLIGESEQSWEEFSYIEEEVRRIYPGHDSEFYRVTIEEAALDLLANGHIEVYRINRGGYPSGIDVQDEKLTLRRARSLLQERQAWLESSESEHTWSVWYRATPDGMEAFNDLDADN